MYDDAQEEETAAVATAAAFHAGLSSHEHKTRDWHHERISKAGYARPGTLEANSRESLREATQERPQGFFSRLEQR